MKRGDGKPLPQLYESLVIPALRLAEADRRAGILPLETRNTIAEATGDIVAALAVGVRLRLQPSHASPTALRHAYTNAASKNIF